VSRLFLHIPQEGDGEMNLQPSDGLLDLRSVLEALAVKSRSSYYKYAKYPGFPRAVRVGGSKGPLKFKAREIAQFIDSLKAGE
jgi:predicted DNA-binding transcriptional regulator AlpA